MSKKQVLTFTDLLPGLWALMRRWPSVVLNVAAYLRLKPDAPLTIGAVLERNAAKHGDRTAILTEDIRITHRSLNRSVNRYARFLASEGIGRGDVVAVWMENRPELLYLVGALAKIGGIAALIDPRQRKMVLRQRLQSAAARACIVDADLWHHFEAVRPDLKLDAATRLYVIPGSHPQPAAGGAVDLVSRTRSFSPENPPADPRITLQSPFAHVFTSGTTGMPKISVQIHRRWIGAMYWFGGVVLNLKPYDVHYCTLPFYHSNALIISWGACAGHGAAMAIRRRFSATEFWRDCRHYRATSFIYVGEICRYLINLPPQNDDRKHRVCRIVGNGLRPEIRQAFKARFGIGRIFEFYGTAEAPLIFTNLLNLDDTVGCCLTPYAIVRYDHDSAQPIRNRQGRVEPVEPGEAGLLISEVSHDRLFRGYASQEETEDKIIPNAFRQGDRWFNSGDILRDLGFRHAQFVDRLGDTFRWKGENVSCTEVEQIVNRFDAVAHALVYGVAVPGAEGRAGMLALVPCGEIDAFDMAALADQLQRHLPPYAVPRFVRLIQRFDLTATYKVKKKDFIDQGFDPRRVSDKMFVLLPGATAYDALTRNLFSEIQAGRYRF